MKKERLTRISLIILATYSLGSCGPSTRDALEYYDTVIGYQEAVIEREELLQDAIMSLIEEDKEGIGISNTLLSEEETGQLLSDLEKAYDAFSEAIDSSLSGLRQMEPFNNSSILRDAAIQLMGVYRETATNEYASIIRLLKKPSHTFSQSDNEYFNELWVKTINLKLNKAIEEFTLVQFEFAGNWQFDLEEGETYFRH